MHHENCIRSDGDWFCAGRCTHHKDTRLRRLEEIAKAAQEVCTCGLPRLWEARDELRELLAHLNDD